MVIFSCTLIFALFLASRGKSDYDYFTPHVGVSPNLISIAVEQKGDIKMQEMAMSVEAVVGSKLKNVLMHFRYCLLHLKFLKWLTRVEDRFTSGAKTVPVNKSPAWLQVSL